MKPSIKRTIFYLVFITLVLLPAVVMLLNWRTERARTWTEVAVLLGFLGMSLAGMQLIPIGKIRWLSDALDMDAVYSNHHKFSMLSVFLVIMHALILLLTNGADKAWVLFTGWVGLGALILIGATSAGRKQIKLGYTAWLILHDLLTLAILVFGLWHIFQVNYYTNMAAIRTIWWIEIAIWAILILYIRLLHPLSVARKPFKVESVVAEPNNTYTLNLLPDGHTGKPFEAGQIAWISTGKNAFKISRNPFSYSGSCEAPEGRVRFSIKEAGDFTNGIKDLKVGDRVFVDGPYGAFNTHLEKTQKGLVLLGGGIGLAPVMSLVHTLADRGDKRPVYVFYGDYSEETALYDAEFKALKERMNLTLVKVLEKPINPDYPTKGYITSDLMKSVLPENYKELMFFVCGPAPMLKAIDINCATLGVPSSQIKVERYEMA